MIAYVLVLNCGSSSIKFAVVNPYSTETVINGIVQNVLTAEGSMQWTYKGQKQSRLLPHVEYQDALQTIAELIQKADEVMPYLVAIGHRVVHGGEKFKASVLIDHQVIDQIRLCSKLAPLHNPANLSGILTVQKFFPELPQVAVFDTAFHQTMPPHAYLYAIPYELYEQHGIRRYGFHGTSHQYVTKQAAKLMNKPFDQCAFISAHLGNGSSLSAVLNGQCLDTSMGMTPLEGLMMGTRSGDIDPSLHAFLVDTLGYDIHKVTDILNKKSGILGVSGIGFDMRMIDAEAQAGNQRAELARDIFCYRLAKYILSYLAPLGRLDALVFTGGIGENDRIVRRKVLGWLSVIGFSIDEKRNETNGKQDGGKITMDDSRLALVIPTNEELVIAQDAIALANLCGSVNGSTVSLEKRIED